MGQGPGRDLDPQDRWAHRERLRAGRQDRPGVRRLNVAFLDSWLRQRSTGSGSAVAIAGLRSGLEALGHPVDVLRPTNDAGTLERVRHEYNLDLPARLADSAHRYDLVVGFDIDGWALTPPIVPGGTSPRYVVALKGIAADERRFESGATRRSMGRMAVLERRNVRNAELVFVSSRYQADVAGAVYDVPDATLRVVPEALDDAIHERAAGARASPGAAGPPVILSVARQYPRKDTATLLRGFAHLLAAGPDGASGARLRIVGDGPELAATRRLAEELAVSHRVEFLGALESVADLDREYRGASVFCLPSRQEGFGIVFLEAMAYGLPIVAAEAGAVPEVAPDGLVSLLVPPRDPEALARALARVLGDAPLASRLSSAGVARSADYTWVNSARAFLAGLAS